MKKIGAKNNFLPMVFFQLIYTAPSSEANLGLFGGENKVPQQEFL
jgi:hypothetical protein